MADLDNPTPGTLNWRLSAHPITLVTFLAFRIGQYKTRAARAVTSKHRS